MSDMVNHDHSSGGNRTQVMKWLGRLNVTLGTLLVVAMTADFVYGSTRPNGDIGGGMLAGILMLYLFMAWIPVGFICLVGAALSFVVWKKYSNQEARTAFWLSLGCPIAGVICFSLVWGIDRLWPSLF
jgi:hypothetical protein